MNNTIKKIDELLRAMERSQWQKWVYGVICDMISDYNADNDGEREIAIQYGKFYTEICVEVTAYNIGNFNDPDDETTITFNKIYKIPLEVVK